MSNIVRNWFREGLNYGKEEFDELKKEKFVLCYLNRQNIFNYLLHFRANNFTQLVWANSKFVGCAGAKMLNGYFFTCFYHPRGNIINESIYKNGVPCSKCSKDRASCSRVFYGLCGIDEIVQSRSTNIHPNYYLMIIFMAPIIMKFIHNKP